MATTLARIQLLSRTKAQLDTLNPVLLAGEVAIADAGTLRPILRVGDGVRPWTQLPDFGSGGGGGGGGPTDWSQITNIPATFAPAAHNQAGTTITIAAGTAGLPSGNAQSVLQAVYTALGGKAPTAHTHAVADVTGLQATLDAHEQSLTSLARDKQDNLPSGPATAGSFLTRVGTGNPAWSRITLATVDGLTAELADIRADYIAADAVVTAAFQAADALLQTAIDGKENALGNPASSNMVLKSTTAGVRSWAWVSANEVNGLQALLDQKENALGNPSQDGMALVSTTTGVRSWGRFAAETRQVSSDDLDVIIVRNGAVGSGPATLAQDVAVHPVTNEVNGLVKLTANKKIPASLIEVTGMTFKGQYDASVGQTPANPHVGDVWIVGKEGVLGVIPPGDKPPIKPHNVPVGSWILYDGTHWNSVEAGMTGNVNAVNVVNTLPTTGVSKIPASATTVQAVINWIAGNVASIDDVVWRKPTQAAEATIDPTADVVRLTLKGKAAHTADLFNALNAAGTPTARITQAGNVVLRGGAVGSTPLTLSAETGQTASLLRVRDSVGTDVLAVAPSGSISMGRSVYSKSYLFLTNEQGHVDGRTFSLTAGAPNELNIAAYDDALAEATRKLALKIELGATANAIRAITYGNAPDYPTHTFRGDILGFGHLMLRSQPADVPWFGLQDDNVAAGERVWTLRSHARLLTLGASADDGSNRHVALSVARGAGADGQKITSMDYGNATDNPTHTFYGVVIADGDLYARGVNARLLLNQQAAPADNRVWALAATVAKQFKLSTITGAGVTKDALVVTQDAGVVKALVYGNATDLPSHTFYGATTIDAGAAASTALTLKMAAAATTSPLIIRDSANAPVMSVAPTGAISAGPSLLVTEPVSKSPFIRAGADDQNLALIFGVSYDARKAPSIRGFGGSSATQPGNIQINLVGKTAQLTVAYGDPAAASSAAASAGIARFGGTAPFGELFDGTTWYPILTTGSGLTKAPATTADNTVTPTAVGAVPLTLKGMAGQTANLLEILTSTNGRVMRVGATGIALDVTTSMANGAQFILLEPTATGSSGATLSRTDTVFLLNSGTGADFHFQVGNVDAARLTTGEFALLAGKTLRLYDPTNAVAGSMVRTANGLDLRSGAATTPITFGGAAVTAMSIIDTLVNVAVPLTMRSGSAITFNNAGNTGGQKLASNAASEIAVATRGAVIHHRDAALTHGSVRVSAATPVAPFLAGDVFFITDHTNPGIAYVNAANALVDLRPAGYEPVASGRARIPAGAATVTSLRAHGCTIATFAAGSGNIDVQVTFATAMPDANYIVISNCYDLSTGNLKTRTTNVLNRTMNGFQIASMDGSGSRTKDVDIDFIVIP